MGIMLAAIVVLPARAQTAPLLGDAGGVRPVLAAHGINFGLSDSENLLAALSGGLKRGATMQGLTTATLDVDMRKALRLPGGSLHVSLFQIHGRALSPYYLADLQTASGNEAENTTRLWELWYDQTLPYGLDIKLGQQSVDNEFIVSANSGLFVNTMAGWPMLPSADLYGGGPAYPLSALGVRLRLVRGGTSLLAGMFDDNPGGGGFAADAQRLDGNGLRFSLQTGALLMAELQQQVTLWGEPGTYKLGAWFDSGKIPDQRYDNSGISLASPASAGIARLHRGNESLYAVADQTIWQGGPRSLNAFLRVMGAPAAQNLIDYSVNGGITLAAPLPGRVNDTAGLDIGYAHVSPRAAALDRDAGRQPRNAETLLELTYQAQATPWLVLQPVVEYVINPGGTGAVLHDELITGVRVVLVF